MTIPPMTEQNAEGIAIILFMSVVLWLIVGSGHSDESKVPAVNTFWIGAIVFMELVYIIFSK